MTALNYKGPEILEFQFKEPLPSGLVCSINNRFVVKIYNSQINIDKTYTVRGIVVEHINPNQITKPKTMNFEAVKKELANLGFAKAHVDILLDAMKGVQFAPLAYTMINKMVLDTISLTKYKEGVSSALKGLEAVAGVEKAKAPIVKKAATVKKEKTPVAAPVLKATPGGNAAADHGADDDLAKAKKVLDGMEKTSGDLPEKLEM